MEKWKNVLAKIKYDDKGLVSAIALDRSSGQVLMLAYMNEATLLKTLETKIMTYWSRSRQKEWIKGETSGNTQTVLAVKLDCDGDALQFTVQPNGIGAACHEGYKSCFFRELNDGQWEVKDKPMFNPNEVYGKN